ncbi:hypothetical protein ACWCWD_26965 [Streptomyces sp. NPDC001493]
MTTQRLWAQVSGVLRLENDRALYPGVERPHPWFDAPIVPQREDAATARS